MKLRILVNAYKDRENIVNGFANSGYPVCVVEGNTAIYESNEYYIVVELPDHCIIKEGEGK